MEPEKFSQLHVVVAPWPIAINLVEHLPAGDLLNLSRSSTSLRAALHDFEAPEAFANGDKWPPVRQSLRIGKHQTQYWERLKSTSPFLCASPSHTKGSDPRPCKYCSKPICEACIVRASMSKPNEGTFMKRCRYLCKLCWDGGRPSKRCRFPTSRAEEARIPYGWYDLESDFVDFCNCSVKDNWVCLECKDNQNQEAAGVGKTTCFGEGCSESLEIDKDRRKICLWCNKPLPVVRVGGETRQVWNQKMMAAKKERESSRRANMEEYNRTRLKQLRMSRRELRGDEAVRGDQDADLRQFVRHLDTINYNRFLPRPDAPNGGAIYASKQGRFVYTQNFLSRFQFRCVGTPRQRHGFKKATSSSSHEFARTNLEKSDYHKDLPAFTQPRQATRTVEQLRDDQWENWKAQILQLYISDKKSLIELQICMHHDFQFTASDDDYLRHLKKWGHYLESSQYQGSADKEIRALSIPSPLPKEDLAPDYARDEQESADKWLAERIQARLFDENMTERITVPMRDLSESHLTGRRHEDGDASEDESIAPDFVASPGNKSPLGLDDTTDVTWIQAPPSGGDEERDEPPSYFESLEM